MVIFIVSALLRMVSSDHCSNKIYWRLLWNLKIFLEKTTTKKGFMAWYLYCTWPASSEGRGLCLIYLCICRICHRTWHKAVVQNANERVNEGAVPFSLSILRWSRLLVCEIERSYQCTSQADLTLFWLSPLFQTHLSAEE